MKEFLNFINEYVRNATARCLQDINPVNGQVIGTFTKPARARLMPPPPAPALKGDQPPVGRRAPQAAGRRPVRSTAASTTFAGRNCRHRQAAPPGLARGHSAAPPTSRSHRHHQEHGHRVRSTCVRPTARFGIELRRGARAARRDCRGSPLNLPLLLMTWKVGSGPQPAATPWSVKPSEENPRHRHAAGRGTRLACPRACTT